MKIKKSKEEIEGYLKTTKSMLQKEEEIKTRILTGSEIYPGELKLVEENIKNCKEMIKLLGQNLD